METMATYICPQCGKEFTRRLAETTRQLRKNPDYKPYCSLKCGGEQGKKYLRRGGNQANLIPNNAQDEYSPFRWHLKRARSRGKTSRKSIDFDVKYLKELWEKQQGICPYTGFRMALRKNTNDYSRLSPYTASLDRIDSSKGYVKGNVEFVCVFINFAKNGWSKEEMLEVIERIRGGKDEK